MNVDLFAAILFRFIYLSKPKNHRKQKGDNQQPNKVKWNISGDGVAYCIYIGFVGDYLVEFRGNQKQVA